MNVGEQFIASLLVDPLPEQPKYKPSAARVFALSRGQKYNITLEEYEHLLQQQGGVCAICFNAETQILASGRLKQLSIDHCHATGMIRGLLCSNCNSLLGHASDNVKTLRAAADYLDSTRKRYLNATPAELVLARQRQEIPE